jgi:ureidoglycolate hydrolase
MKRKLEKQKELDVNIDFDEASKCWRENKKVGLNGMFSYICNYKLPNGKKCQKPYYSKSINYTQYINSNESNMNSNENIPMNSNIFIPMNSNIFIPMNSNIFIPMNSNENIPMNSNENIPMNSNIFIPMYCHKHFLMFLNHTLEYEKEKEKNIIQTRSKRKILD